jgi:hypothetical protein
MTVATIDRAKKRAPEQPECASLWEALAEAQSRFGPIVKDTKGARGKYAPLDAVLEMVRPILNECGLVLTQPTYVDGDTMFVRTTVVHRTTGESHDCSYPAGPLTLQHQQLGAGTTYARRYSLLSLLGIFPEAEDDDGERAGAAGGERLTPRDPQPRQQSTNASQAKKADVWPRFVEKLRSFTDLDELERWWSDASTQRAVDGMPGQWPEQAHEEYEKKQEALASAGAP